MKTLNVQILQVKIFVKDFRLVEKLVEFNYLILY